MPYIWTGNSYDSAGVYTDTLSGGANDCDSILTLILNVNPVLTDTTTVTVCANQLPYTWNGNSYDSAGVYTDTLSGGAGGCDTLATLILNVSPILTDTTTVTVCANQLPYTWNGNSYDSAGVYTDTLSGGAGGCDTLATLILSVSPALAGSEIINICQNQLPFTWNGQILTQAGTATATLQSSAGCDSLVTLSLIVNPNVTGNETITICQNQLPYTWNGQTLTQAGTATATLQSSAGCDSLVTLTLIVNPNVTGSETITICQNQLPYTWNGQTLTQAGTATATLQSSAGCDSLVTLTLIVNPVLTGSETVTICQSQLPYTWNGQTLAQGGTATATLQSSAGCDSLATLTLIVNPVLTGSETVTICQNQLPYTWNGQTLTQAGTATVTLQTSAGCDSLVTLTLNVNPNVTGSETITICQNLLPYTWNGQILTQAGTATATLQSSAGCDSLVTLTLIVNPNVTGNETITICQNLLPYSWNGQTLTQAGTATATLQSSAGCDSLVTLTLIVNPNVTGSETITICQNQLPYTWNGQSLTQAGTATATLQSSAGCDSVVTLTLIVNPNVSSNETITVCQNQLPYSWNGQILTQGGTATATLQSSSGCDSVVTLTLIVNPVLTGSETVTICQNQLPYTWNGQTLTQAGTVTVTLLTNASCDSLVTLTLIVNPNVTGSETITICQNLLPYTWNGQTLTQAGTATATLQSSAGCDSLVTLTLIVNPNVTGNETITICQNLLPYTWNGQTLTQAGTTTVTLQSSAGCDSLVTLTLIVNPNVTGSETITICQNQLPYTWNGQTLTQAGTVTATLQSSAGCDSLATLTLNVNLNVTGSETITICQNQLPYTWNGQTLTQAGTATTTLQSSAGCDSLVTLTLNVNPNVTGSETITICQNLLPYTWNGQTLTQAGTTTVTLQSSAGCDSLVTLTLVVNPNVTGAEIITICETQLPYTWNGQTLTQAGTATATLQSSAGCDSLVTLTLIVNPTVTGSETITICQNQLPFTWNGQTLNQAGTTSATLQSSTGCDSLVTLTLVVNPNVTGSENITICQNQLPYTWNGQTLMGSGTYTATLPSQFGCDSVATLLFVVNPLLTDTTIASVCVNQLPYTWNGNTYNATGVYTDTLPASSGCDTIATLILNINPLLVTTTQVSVCANQLPYIWYGNAYSSTGTYVDTIPANTGCDTVATLVLIVNPLIPSTQTVTICANQLPYNWYGNNYNAPGTYTDTIPASTGCDTVATLVLTVKPTSSSLTNVTICQNELPYNWNGNNYNAAGTYNVTLTGANGCDSVATLILDVLASPVLVVNNPPPVCEPATVDLTAPSITAGSSPGLTFTYWSDPGATIPLANPTAVSQSGTYYIKATGVNNCTTTQPVEVTVIVTKVPPGVRYATLTAQPNIALQLTARNLGISFTWTPPIGLSATNIRNPIFQHTTGMEYNVRIVTDSGCIIIDTVLIRMEPSQAPVIRSDIFVPKAWSPNRDGHNDKLFPLTVNIAELKYFRIFNRWGQLVFETRTIGHGWDGIFKGIPQVQDTYTWTLEAIGEDGRHFKKAGNSILLR
ncbi:MAG TPA: gliding motility-associated C-terminal domain-containing protein [Chitinophagaceae bacterium]|nr:gliding motility-associated C-terminal domain-containing protein [Chitinophagaceae bacterium]